MRKKFLLFTLLILLAALFSSEIKAAKRRPKRTSRGATTQSTSFRSRGVAASIRFRPDRRALLIDFGSFGNVTQVSYSLTYTSDGVSQGVSGTVSPDQTGQREVLFGTCSGGVCRYHENITDARLVIDSQLSSNLIIRKPYRIKV